MQQQHYHIKYEWFFLCEKWYPYNYFEQYMIKEK